MPWMEEQRGLLLTGLQGTSSEEIPLLITGARDAVQVLIR
jgi:hypothetical protein